MSILLFLLGAVLGAAVGTAVMGFLSANRGSGDENVIVIYPDQEDPEDPADEEDGADYGC